MGYLIGTAMVIAAIGATIAAIRFGSKQRQRKADAQLRSAPVDILAAQVASAVDLAGWSRIGAAAELRAHKTWTEQELLNALDALWQALIKEDEEKRRSGRDSNYFDFYDFGLARISETLRDRLGMPQPWERTPRLR